MQIQAAQRITATDAMLRDIYSDGNEGAPVKKLIHDQASEAGDGVIKRERYGLQREALEPRSQAGDGVDFEAERDEKRRRKVDEGLARINDDIDADGSALDKLEHVKKQLVLD
jgi:hypothetical protein